MNKEDVIKLGEKLFFHTYNRYPIVPIKGEGVRIYDADGSVYLDMLSGIGVNALGYGDEKIANAIKTQAYKYAHVSNYFFQEPQVKLAEALLGKTAFDRAFFANSGTEAIEGAIKLARKWGARNGKTKIIAFDGGFHGRTYGALSLMNKPRYKKDMGPYLENVETIPFNEPKILEEKIDEKVAAVFLEFVQGEGGIVVAKADFVEKLLELKEKFGFLLVADEIQSGLGRTGSFLACQLFGAEPDVATLAKALGGGLPLGAILAREEIAKNFAPGDHGSTFGGSPIACAAGLVVVEALTPAFLKRVREIGDCLENALAEIKSEFPGLVLEIRGRGLMRGLALSFDPSILVAELLKRKTITNVASGNVLRLLPPLIIERSDIEEFRLALGDSLLEIVKNRL